MKKFTNTKVNGSQGKYKTYSALIQNEADFF